MLSALYGPFWLGFILLNSYERIDIRNLQHCVNASQSTCDNDVITNDDSHNASYRRVADSSRAWPHWQHLAIWEIY